MIIVDVLLVIMFLGHQSQASTVYNIVDGTMDWNKRIPAFNQPNSLIFMSFIIPLMAGTLLHALAVLDFTVSLIDSFTPS